MLYDILYIDIIYVSILAGATYDIILRAYIYPVYVDVPVYSNPYTPIWMILCWCERVHVCVPFWWYRFIMGTSGSICGGISSIPKTKISYPNILQTKTKTAVRIFQLCGKTATLQNRKCYYNTCSSIYVVYVCYGLAGRRLLVAVAVAGDDDNSMAFFFLSPACMFFGGFVRCARNGSGGKGPYSFRMCGRESMKRSGVDDVLKLYKCRCRAPAIFTLCEAVES